MSQQQERRRQTYAERFRDAIARRGRACFAWTWAHKRFFLVLEALFALAAIGPAVVAGVIFAAGLTPIPALSVFGPAAGLLWALYTLVLWWSRHIYRAQYGGRYDARLAPYVVSRVSELNQSDYVPTYASAIDQSHPTARLVRDALRTAKRSSLSRARFHPDAPLPVGVCIFGQPLQDKTSLAWEAMRRVLPGWTFVKWPHLMDTTHDIVTNAGKRVVLWLDDLHEYGNRLESVTLDDLIDRFARAQVQVVVVATCRWHDDEREARTHLGYLLDHLLPIRLATTQGDRAEDPVVLQPTVDQPVVHSAQTPSAQTPSALQTLIDERLISYRRLKSSLDPVEKGAYAVLRAMEILWSAGILVYTQERVRVIAKDFGLGVKDEDLRAALRVLVKEQFIRRMPELDKHGRVYRFRTNVWNWVRRVKPVKSSDIRPVSGWYFERVIKIEEEESLRPGVALLEIWNALKTSNDTAALILLGDAYLDSRRTYLRNSASQAIQCYEAARDALTATSRPVQWAAAQIGLGNAYLVDAGRTARDGRSTPLESALTAYQAVTGTPELPARVLKAEAWQGVGHAQRTMADDALKAGNESRAQSKLGEAEEAYAKSIEQFRECHTPFQWALVQYELANVYSEQAKLERAGNATRSVDRLQKANAAFQLAREVYTRASAPTDWAHIQSDLGAALLSLGKQTPDTSAATRKLRLDTLQQAVDALRAALNIFRLFRMDANWAAVSVTLGQALLAEEGALPNDDAVRRQDTLTQAVEAYQTALQYYRMERAPLEWGRVQIELARVYQQQAEVARLDFGASDPNIPPKTYLNTAKDCVEQTIDVLYKAPFGASFNSVLPEMQTRLTEATKLLRELTTLLQA